MVASWASLPSRGMGSDTLVRRLARCSNRGAASWARGSVSNKSIVCPCVSSARESYRHATCSSQAACGDVTRPRATGCMGHPLVERGLIVVDTPLLPACCARARAQRIRPRPAAPHAEDLWGAMGLLASARPRHSPSGCTGAQRGGSYLQPSQFKTCDIYGPAHDVKGDSRRRTRVRTDAVI